MLKRIKQPESINVLLRITTAVSQSVIVYATITQHTMHEQTNRQPATSARNTNICVNRSIVNANSTFIFSNSISFHLSIVVERTKLK